MNNLADALREARSNYVLDDYANAVKRLMADHLSIMEPEAQIEDTLYFNHSAIPDFVLTWGNEKKRRDIYVRASYAAIMAGDEPGQIDQGDPIFMSLDTEQNYSEPDFKLTPTDLEIAARGKKYTLLTDASALTEIATPAGKSTPLSSAVRSNFLKGARGLVDEPVAEALVEGKDDAGGPKVSDLIRDKFSEDAVFRMERTAALVQWALADSEEQSNFSSPVLQGKMSTEELRNVLPWMLHQEKLTENPVFWGRLGAMMTFQQLEELSSELDGLDMTSLVRANGHRWLVRRGYLGLNVTEDGEYPTQPVWSFNGGTLGLGLRERMVRVSHSGRKLKSRPGSVSPRWDTVKEHLDEYRLRSVSLAGIERSLTIEARQSDDINSDVVRLAESVADDYFVDKVEVGIPSSLEGGEAASIEVDFAGSLASSHVAVPLAAITMLALNVIGHDNPVGKDELDFALGSPDEQNA